MLESFSTLEDFDHIDPVAAREFLTFDYIPSPRSILREVRKLDPGCRLIWRMGNDEIRSDQYWSPPLRKEEICPPDEFELEELLAHAVKRQMISDVPIGVFLSGSLDSSLLVALTARQSGKPIRTFSVSFDNSVLDESSITGLVARQFGVDDMVLPAEDLGPDMLLDLLGCLDELFCHPAVVPTYALSKMARAHIKVVLSGNGGDEVFGGYPKYLLGKQNRQGLWLGRLLH